MSSPNPARSSVAIDISATDHNLETSCRGIYVGGAGNIICRLVGDSSDRTFSNVLAGTVLPVQASKITRTGTTATLMVALF